MKETQEITSSNEYRSVPIGILMESATNPRQRFDEKNLEELAASMRAQGILAPLLVRELSENKYEVVAGARRLRAAKLAELETLPVRVCRIHRGPGRRIICGWQEVSLLIRGSARRLHLNDVPTPTFS